ncbi:hypothetical protein CNMCM5793_000926 [Aspergillus hiratsukae]|uniref:Uncharacterized protein n=1 Tax=Aspergillus hiratsukae TaxID=1194566 RepID=A0A8H6PZ46_9EURO|nr:hypothetical protein CNMCM5793_000926 [Aspergillus hiratsukae]KAF7163451.1 hypothetical protein CNMCM6106_000401 [Aspergillus hiratsukae]
MRKATGASAFRNRIAAKDDTSHMLGSSSILYGADDDVATTFGDCKRIIQESKAKATKFAIWLELSAKFATSKQSIILLDEWSSVGHIPIHESVTVNSWDSPSGQPGWDYVHVNAVDKNAAGDYILSARFTNTIYLVSGQDGHIIWRLGGKFSDFVQDFTFSKQHHVQFVETNETHTTISPTTSTEQANLETAQTALANIRYSPADTASRPTTPIDDLRFQLKAVADAEAIMTEELSDTIRRIWDLEPGWVSQAYRATAKYRAEDRRPE